jgi:hypothetical protein
MSADPQPEVLSLRFECKEIIETLRNAATLAGYEVTLPAGNVLIYGLCDQAVIDTFRQQLGENAIEPLYKFAAADAVDPNQTELFEGSSAR